MTHKELTDFIKWLRTEKYYTREGDPYQYTFSERGVRSAVADELEGRMGPAPAKEDK